MLKVFVLGVLILGSCLGKEENGKRRVLGKPRRSSGAPPAYAVPMEPLVHYSQRDPLYHKRLQASASHFEPPTDDDPSRSDKSGLIDEAVANERYEVGSYYPPPYYTQPEPIIEIIIKESNESLPTTPRPPTPPSTKEPIHVFYVKYKKNPNPKGKNDQIIYDPPIPALMPHSSDIRIQDDNRHRVSESTTFTPPSTTTLRTIIRPDSETYHSSNAGIKVTFGNPEETELEEGSEQRPRVALPPDSLHQASGLVPNYRPDLNHNPHSYPQPHQYRILQAPPSQIFNSQSQTPINPPGSALGPVQESSFQNSKFVPPTDEQIRQYQQEKLYLYRQSLKQQNTPPPSSVISPIIPPQQFQQPTSNPPSQLQVNFHQKQQFLQQAHPQDHHQQFKQTGLSHQSHKPIQLHQKSNSFQNFPSDQFNKQQHVHHNTPQPLSDRNRIQSHSNANRNIYTANHEQKQQSNFFHSTNRPPPVPGLEGIKQDSIQPGISVYERTIISQEIPKRPLESRPVPKPELQFNYQLNRYKNINQGERLNNQQTIYKPNYKDGDIIESVAQSEEHQVTPDYRNEFFPSFNEPPKRSKLPESEDPLQFYPVYSTTSPTTQKQISPRISTTVQRTQSTLPQPSYTTSEKPFHDEPTSTHQEEIAESPMVKENKTAVKTNLAVLPDEVPEDLRAQLLSSGILNNADIQILDYDKVGDIPIESLPPEALENFYSAGSDPVPSVIKPDIEQTETKTKNYNPFSDKGQKVAKSYLKKYEPQLETKALKDSKYNRYLPLKVNGTEFSLPDNTQLKGRVINSVVVLAPVDYDFIREKDEGDERAGKAIQVEGVRFIAGEALKDLVKNPTRENYSKWLEQERNTPTRHQSVVLLITR